jgi:hypothetical protein
MEHNILAVESNGAVHALMINHQQYHIDHIDNLDTIPSVPAVFAICGRVNGVPANARMTGESENLQQSVRDLFSGKGAPCITTFMQSVKTKILLFELMEESSAQERIAKKQAWERKFKPLCNEELNKVH